MDKAKIYYYDIGDYLSREDKLDIIRKFGSIENIPWTVIAPNEHGDWINHRNEMFNLFFLLGNKDDKKDKKTFFVPYYSSGVKTNRDVWCYNFCSAKLKSNIETNIAFYNEQCDKIISGEIEDVEIDLSKFSWSYVIRNRALEGRKISYDEGFIIQSMYRPFCKQQMYFGRNLNENQYLINKTFKNEETENLWICVSSIGANKDFSALIVNCIPCLDLVEKSQCFPLYWYDDSASDIADLFNQGAVKPIERYARKDGVTDWILTSARKRYGNKVTKEDIFYYVYGILHSSDYRSTFATDLKKSLPRLPLVEKANDFWAFSQAGRALAELHLNYEAVEPYRKCQVLYAPLTTKGESVNYHVEKMRFGKIDSKTVDKSVIYYNHAITIENIPVEAYEYIVNGKSAIEWIMERYAITTDPKSGITNDPNDWAKEHNDEKYILNLLLRIIHVSVQTVEIVKKLPKLKFE